MTDRELMQEALYALTYVGDAKEIYSDTIESLRARLAQPEQEHSEQWWRHEVSNAFAQGYEKGRASVKQPEPKPVAWMDSDGFPWTKQGVECRTTPDTYTPLYTALPQREWQGLTDEEILEEYRQSYGDDGNLTDIYFAHAIEAKLKEKNT